MQSVRSPVSLRGQKRLLRQLLCRSSPGRRCGHRRGNPENRICSGMYSQHVPVCNRKQSPHNPGSADPDCAPKEKLGFRLSFLQRYRRESLPDRSHCAWSYSGSVPDVCGPEKPVYQIRLGKVLRDSRRSQHRLLRRETLPM